MPTQSPLSSELRERYEAESARLQHDFSTTKDGLKYLRERSALVDSIARRLWAQFVASPGFETSQIVFAAVGDFVFCQRRDQLGPKATDGRLTRGSRSNGD